MIFKIYSYLCMNKKKRNNALAFEPFLKCYRKEQFFAQLRLIEDHKNLIF